MLSRRKKLRWKKEVRNISLQFANERETLRFAITKNAHDISEEIGSINTDLEYLNNEQIKQQQQLQQQQHQLKSPTHNNISEQQTAGGLESRVKILENELRETQMKACHNQIQLEALKVESGDSLQLIQEELVRLEKDIITTNQYNRRQNLVIEGIPDHVPQHHLENVCLDIIHKIGFEPVGNYEVVGCHRIRKGPHDVTSPTIIRFINRKVPEFCKRNRWRLQKVDFGNWSLNFRDDLCEANTAILHECENLKERGVLSKVFTYNGFVKVAVGNARPIKVCHKNDLANIIGVNVNVHDNPAFIWLIHFSASIMIFNG